MDPVALITGIGGQDGSYLAEHLLADGYKVHGLIRRQSVSAHQNSRISHLGDRVCLHYGDMLDPMSLMQVVSKVRPDEVYNLAAQSHVRISFDMPVFTVHTNGLGVLHLLEACRLAVPKARIYQASSSEMFGTSIDSDGYQRESTLMVPTSPYGCAKVLGYNLIRHYRAAYGMHACNGILFNHESPRRGENFVSMKIVRGAVAIKHGRRETLELGNVDAVRDWGHSRDYTRAMRLIVRHEPADDFVVATGSSHSVLEMVEFVFRELGLDPGKYVSYADRLRRPQELPRLRGDASKARNILGWRPEYNWENLLREMIAKEMERPCAAS